MKQVYVFAHALLREENKSMVVLTARTCDFISWWPHLETGIRYCGTETNVR